MELDRGGVGEVGGDSIVIGLGRRRPIVVSGIQLDVHGRDGGGTAKT